MDAGADDFIVKPVCPQELRVRIRAGERVLELTRTVAEKNKELDRSHKRLQTAYEQMERDLKAAAWIQESLLPRPGSKTHGLACNWRFRPSGYLGGDMLDFFPIDERYAGFYLLDVSGKGASAGVFSVALNLLLAPDGCHPNLLRRSASEVFKPADVVQQLNRLFQSRNDTFFAMTYGVFDRQTSLLRLAQAGNPNPVLIKPDGQVNNLTAGGMPVGLWPDMDLDSVEFPVTPGDRLMLCSDGITQCTNAARQEFGDHRLLEYLSGAAKQPLDAMLSGLERHLDDWRGPADFNDDISMLAVEITG
jgi:sigma-B regulation protein RsbU (phosphoserine phosphatase)